MQLKDLIDKAESIAGGTTALARLIGTPATHIHNWKSGIRACQAEDRALLADAAGVDPLPEIAEAMAERWAGKPKGERLKAVLTKRLKSVGNFYDSLRHLFARCQPAPTNPVRHA